MDDRFDRLYIFKIEENELSRLEQLCDEYDIFYGNVFETAAKFHRIWGIGPSGIVYLSYGMAQYGFDFNSIEELEDYLSKFIVNN